MPQVRFLSDLVNCHVIAAPSMVAMFENFVSVTQEEDVPQVDASALRVCTDLAPFWQRLVPNHSAWRISVDVLLVSSGSLGLVCICGALVSSLGGKRAL